MVGKGVPGGSHRKDLNLRIVKGSERGGDGGWKIRNHCGQGSDCAQKLDLIEPEKKREAAKQDSIALATK